MTRSSKISAIGMYVPDKVLTNEELEKQLNRPGTSDWLIKNVGIKKRHIMSKDQTTSDLALEASKEALKNAEISPEDIDLIVLSTDTPDYLSPATSVVLQHKLGALKSGTFDVNSACAGFVTALVTGNNYIVTDEEINTVLVVGAYGMTKFVNWDDHYTATLFADGAGAMVLESIENKKGFLANKLIADGQYHDYLGIFKGGTYNSGLNQQEKQFVSFQKRFPAELNSETWPKLINDTLHKAKLTKDDVDYYFFTQLNINTITQVMESLNQPMSKTHTIMDKWGYTGSACIPMAMYDSMNQNILPKIGEGLGKNILLCSSGGGYNMASCLFKWW